MIDKIGLKTTLRELVAYKILEPNENEVIECARLSGELHKRGIRSGDPNMILYYDPKDDPGCRREVLIPVDKEIKGIKTKMMPEMKVAFIVFIGTDKPMEYYYEELYKYIDSEDLKPASHTINFAHSHADFAKNGVDEMSSGMSCNDCHQQSFCQECHEGENLDETTHPLNYAFTHALEAQSKEKDCNVCHQDQQFCNACHRDYQIYPHNHQQSGWAIAVGGGLHAVEASNDLESCISCHEVNAEEICQPCHQQ